MRVTDRKWIRITTNFKAGGDDYFKDERIFEDAEKATSWVKAGWAVDLDGEVPAGTPDTAPKALLVQDGVHNLNSDPA